MPVGVVANTNIASISSARILAANRKDLETAMERLSSGKRINSASDDAAGMAVAAKLRADVRSLNQAVRNANDAISLVNTYDGASAEIENILVRLRELAVQSSTGTYGDADRTLAQKEVTQLLAEINRIAENTTFNGIAIGDQTKGTSDEALDATLDSDGAADLAVFKFRVGPQPSTADDASVALYGLKTSQLDTGFASISVASASNASSAVKEIDDALTELASNRAVAGAFVNRLTHTITNLQNVSQRTQEALSGIEDADYAAESAALARGMVLAQAGTAMLAQANQAPQYILALLRS